MILHIVTACKRSLGQGNIFSSVSRILYTEGDDIPACIAGGIPVCLAGLQGGGIPACLAGLQAHTQGEVEGSGLRGGLQAHTQGGS